MKWLPIVVLLMWSSTTAADDERVLLPVAISRQPWFTQWQFYNSGTSPVQFEPSYHFCNTRPPYQCGPPETISPGSSGGTGLTSMPPPGNPTPGRFLYFSSATPVSVAIDVRVAHASRLDIDTALILGGAQIPVVRERDFSEKIVLQRIVLRAPYTQTLRIYEHGNRGDLQFRLRFFRDGVTYGERIVTTRRAEGSYGDEPPFDLLYPAGVQIGDLFTAFPELNAARLYGCDLEITPIEPGTRFWAFISLTNRNTNEVSLVVPE